MKRRGKEKRFVVEGTKYTRILHALRRRRMKRRNGIRIDVREMDVIRAEKISAREVLRLRCTSQHGRRKSQLRCDI